MSRDDNSEDIRVCFACDHVLPPGVGSYADLFAQNLREHETKLHSCKDKP